MCANIRLVHGSNFSSIQIKRFWPESIKIGPVEVDRLNVSGCEDNPLDLSLIFNAVDIAYTLNVLTERI